MVKVGITGGIGSGKSTLCDIFRQFGTPVYNSDEEAKRLMRDDADLRSAIISSFGAQSYCGGELNREYISSIVFAIPERLAELNSIVHPRVKLDFEKWANQQDAPYVILECAILFEAEFDKYVDISVCVLSPKPLRIERIKSRDGLSQSQIESRIDSQLSDDVIHSKSTYSIVNIEIDDLNEAAKMLDKKFIYEASRN